jgi:hypothetical protein
VAEKQSSEIKPGDPGEHEFDQVELIMQAKALTYMLEDLIESSDNNGADPNAPDGLKQKQYACVRALRMHLAEVEALSNALAVATITKSKGGDHG